MLWQEIRDAWRRLCRRPGYAALSIGVLGVGLGLTLFVFNLVHALIIDPLPFPHADRLVAIGAVRDASGGPGDVGVGIDDLDSAQYQLLQRSLSGMEAFGAYQQAESEDGPAAADDCARVTFTKITTDDQPAPAAPPPP